MKLLRIGTISPSGGLFSLPAGDVPTQTIVVYGARGMGKTNFGTVLCEECAAAGIRFSYIDPMGQLWGLRHSADGKGEGIAVLILGGRHGDIPIEPTSGAIVADLVADEDVSVIIDISRRPDGRMWSKRERIRFVRDYCALASEAIRYAIEWFKTWGPQGDDGEVSSGMEEGVVQADQSKRRGASGIGPERGESDG